MEQFINELRAFASAPLTGILIVALAVICVALFAVFVFLFSRLPTAVQYIAVILTVILTYGLQDTPCDTSAYLGDGVFPFTPMIAPPPLPLRAPADLLLAHLVPVPESESPAWWPTRLGKAFSTTFPYGATSKTERGLEEGYSGELLKHLAKYNWLRSGQERLLSLRAYGNSIEVNARKLQENEVCHREPKAAWKIRTWHSPRTALTCWVYRANKSWQPPLREKVRWLGSTRKALDELLELDSQTTIAMSEAEQDLQMYRSSIVADIRDLSLQPTSQFSHLQVDKYRIRYLVSMLHSAHQAGTIAYHSVRRQVLDSFIARVNATEAMAMTILESEMPTNITKLTEFYHQADVLFTLTSHMLPLEAFPLTPPHNAVYRRVMMEWIRNAFSHSFPQWSDINAVQVLRHCPTWKHWYTAELELPAEFADAIGLPVRDASKLKSSAVGRHGGAERKCLDVREFFGLESEELVVLREKSEEVWEWMLMQVCA